MMKIAEIVHVGDKESLIRLEGEVCDRVLDNETIVDIYMKNHKDNCIFPKTSRKQRGGRKEYTKRTIIEIIEKYYL